MLTDDIPDLRALRMSPAIDVYAAASTVYELIAGVVPYEAAPSTSGTSGSRKKTRDIASPYRLKTDTRPDYPIGAHAPGCDLTQLLRREPDVALAAAEQAQQLGLEPDSEELRDALAFVDAQLFDVVMACLSSHQKDRPEPAAVEAALSAFGINTGMLSEAEMLFREEGPAKGPNVMYFETGQGSELSSSAAFGSDQQTMECRCYGLARHYHPFLVNTVVGFMGPEYIYDTKQLTRAALEDVFCGHLHGLPMGCDVCYTNHMPTDQNDSETILTLLGTAGVHYVMGLPQADDIMLMYQSTSYHDVASIRQLLKKEPIPEFKAWLEKRGIWENGHLGPNAGDPSIFFK